MDGMLLQTFRHLRAPGGCGKLCLALYHFMDDGKIAQFHFRATKHGSQVVLCVSLNLMTLSQREGYREAVVGVAKVGRNNTRDGNCEGTSSQLPSNQFPFNSPASISANCSGANPSAAS